MLFNTRPFTLHGIYSFIVSVTYNMYIHNYCLQSSVHCNTRSTNYIYRLEGRREGGREKMDGDMEGEKKRVEVQVLYG